MAPQNKHSFSLFFFSGTINRFLIVWNPFAVLEFTPFITGSEMLFLAPSLWARVIEAFQWSPLSSETRHRLVSESECLPPFKRSPKTHSLSNIPPLPALQSHFSFLRRGEQRYIRRTVVSFIIIQGQNVQAPGLSCGSNKPSLSGVTFSAPKCQSVVPVQCQCRKESWPIRPFKKVPIVTRDEVKHEKPPPLPLGRKAGHSLPMMNGAHRWNGEETARHTEIATVPPNCQFHLSLGPRFEWEGNGPFVNDARARIGKLRWLNYVSSFATLHALDEPRLFSRLQRASFLFSAINFSCWETSNKGGRNEKVNK